jgi:hypothetical protein
VPLVVTVIDELVSPFGSHWYDAPALAFRTTLPPEQKVVGPLAVAVAAGGVFTATTCAALEVQPFASVAVTV